jgi:hypothetical protein
MHCGCVGELANVYGSFVMPCKRSRAFVILVSAVVVDTSASASDFPFLYQNFDYARLQRYCDVRIRFLYGERIGLKTVQVTWVTRTSMLERLGVCVRFDGLCRCDCYLVSASCCNLQLECRNIMMWSVFGGGTLVGYRTRCMSEC